MDAFEDYHGIEKSPMSWPDHLEDTITYLDLENTITHLEGENDRLGERCDLLWEENENVKQENARLLWGYKQQDGNEDIVLEENERLKQKTARLLRENENLKREKKNAKNREEGLKKQNQQLQQANKKLELLHDLSTADIEVLEAEVTKLKLSDTKSVAFIGELQTKINHLELSRDESAAFIGELQTERADLEQQYERNVDAPSGKKLDEQAGKQLQDLLEKIALECIVAREEHKTNPSNTYARESEHDIDVYRGPFPESRLERICAELLRDEMFAANKNIQNMLDGQSRSNRERKNVTKGKIRKQFDKAIKQAARKLRDDSTQKLQVIVDSVEQIGKIVGVSSAVWSAKDV